MEEDQYREMALNIDNLEASDIGESGSDNYWDIRLSGGGHVRQDFIVRRGHALSSD